MSSSLPHILQGERKFSLIILAQVHGQEWCCSVQEMGTSHTQNTSGDIRNLYHMPVGVTSTIQCSREYWHSLWLPLRPIFCFLLVHRDFSLNLYLFKIYFYITLLCEYVPNTAPSFISNYEMVLKARKRYDSVTRHRYRWPQKQSVKGALSFAAWSGSLWNSQF